jgi:LmbE family N-acetylglucosaminyl deacetylase
MPRPLFHLLYIYSWLIARLLLVASRSLLVSIREENCLPVRLLSRSRLRLLRRYIWLGLALPCVYVGAASIAFVVRQRQANAALASTRLPVLPTPSATTRLMVFAPHCDDETLGCAGLIQQTLAAGGKAQAVILTNGDGFRTAVECQTHRLRVTPEDFIQFAGLRQQESVRALANLGIVADDVHFLGYPDQGLQSLWNDNWTPDRLYTSRTTQCDHAPYANVFHKETPYCGQSVMDDIKANLRAFRPTLVTVTHPAEDHADHAATAAFVARALQELQADPAEAKWAVQTKLEYYLVHRGDWPLPASGGGSGASSPLLPPVEMTRADTRWMGRPLTPGQTRRKAQSIGLYPSQTTMMGRFLNAFARSSELYGEIAPTRLSVVPDNAIRVDANSDDWESLPPCLLDPVRDNVLRDLQGSGDIRALYACRDSRYLYVRLDCRQPVSRRLTYTLHLRAFANDGQTTTKATVIQLRAAPPGTVTPEGIRLASQNRTLEAAIPWELLTRDMQGAKGEEKRQKAEEETGKTYLLPSPFPIRSIAVSAETWAGFEIDKTGVRFLEVAGG